ncbi:MAG: hypothetical protein LAO30_05805 [Acidobacteriia bacterium]|nr:hypothetical protein [Terriglobia bacterium]
MFCNKTIAGGLALVVFGTTALLSQTTVGALGALAGLEFPVTMRQKVEAGKTPVGTKVQAKLTVATLVNGVVLPEGAILSGEVIESVAKSATDPSRLGIRMDSAQWKNGSVPVVLALVPKVYLTAWYYPAARPTNDSVNDASRGASENTVSIPRRSSRGGVYSGQTSQPSLGGDINQDKGGGPVGSSPESDVTKHRVLMKGVESTRQSDGAVTLTCKRSNIKLDRSTTYVLAAGELRSSK